jgi:hypothetical protein
MKESHNLTPSVRLAALAALLALIGGCSGNSRPARTPVSGTVTYQGKPVDGATVTFAPMTEGAPTATAVTDSSGKYVLNTYEEGDGAVPGDYRVTFSKVVIEDKMAGKSIDEISEAYAAMKARGEAIPEPKTRHLIPDRYATSQTSTETANVKEGVENTFDFELTD